MGLVQLIVVLLFAPVILCFGDFWTPEVKIYIVKNSSSVKPSDGHIIDECDALQASFGDQLSFNAIYPTCAIPVRPDMACTGPVLPSPANMTLPSWCVFDSQASIQAEFAMTERGNCTFVTKAFNAEFAKYAGIFIINSDDSPINMGGGPGEKNVHIPALSIGQDCGNRLLKMYPYDKGYSIRIRVMYFVDWTKYLIPFVAILGICFVIMVAAMIVKCFRDRRRQNRRRLSKRNLKKIPVKKYKKGAEPDVCPVCLEEFADGEKLRVLPCNHLYHMQCVDPWLLKNRKVCPVCKRKVLPGSDDSSDEETENASTSTSHETVPLLTPDGQRIGTLIGNSTFYSNYDSVSNAAQTLEDQANTSEASGENFSPDLHNDRPRGSRSQRVVSGFTANTGGSGRSTENLVMPIYEEDEEDHSSDQKISTAVEGADNSAFDQGEHGANRSRNIDITSTTSWVRDPHARRKRHPAEGSRRHAPPPIVSPRILQEELPIHQAVASQRPTVRHNTRTAKSSAMTAGPRHETFRRSVMEAQSVPNFLPVSSQGFTQSDAGPSRLRTDDDNDGTNAVHHPMLGVVEVETSPNHDDDGVELNVAGDKNYVV